MRFVISAFAALIASTAPFVQPSAIRPIGSLTSNDYADLAFLKALLADVRIVQLGEAGHGMGEDLHVQTAFLERINDQLRAAYFQGKDAGGSDLVVIDGNDFDMLGHGAGISG